MGSYTSRLYLLQNLERHECDKCVYTKKMCFYDQFYVKCPFRIYCNMKKITTDEPVEYLLQTCTETEKSKDCTFVVIDPVYECALMPEMLGKIYFTKTPQTRIEGDARTMLNLLNRPEYFHNNINVECSYICDFRTLKKIKEFKPLFDEFSDWSTSNLIYVDNTGPMCWDNATNLNVCKTINLKKDERLASIESVSIKRGEGPKIQVRFV